MKNVLLVLFFIILLSNFSFKNKQMKEKIKIEFQHFEGCPNGPSLLKNLKLAIQGFQDDIDLKNIIVDTPELAKKHRFLGSPTILINGKDIEGLELLEDPNLTCRVYRNGIPTVEIIKNRIKEILDKEK